MTPYRYFDPSSAARFRRLGFAAHGLVEGLLTGRHRSPHVGSSVEFREHREYTPGDELRSLDWRSYARTDRLYVKRFEQETNLECRVLLDCSASMAFPSASDKPTKFDYAARLAALLAFVLVSQGDGVGLIAFNDQPRIEIPPASTAGRLDRLFRALETLTCTGSTGAAATLHRLAGTLRRRGLVVLISDLYDDPRELIRGLRHLRQKRHHVAVFHVLSPEELELPYDRMLTFVDQESGQQVQTDAREIRQSYQAELQAFIRTYRHAATAAGIDYAQVSLATPVEQTVQAFLNGRGNR